MVQENRVRPDQECRVTCHPVHTLRRSNPHKGGRIGRQTGRHAENRHRDERSDSRCLPAVGRHVRLHTRQAIQCSKTLFQGPKRRILRRCAHRIPQSVQSAPHRAPYRECTRRGEVLRRPHRRDLRLAFRYGSGAGEIQITEQHCGNQGGSRAACRECHTQN